MKYIVVDFEMNPVAKEYKEEKQISKMEIIEIGAVIMVESFLILGEFKTLVKPMFNSEIYKKYATLTGISTQMVAGAPTFTTAYEMFVNWCESYGDEYEIYAWSENDSLQLLAEMEQKKYRNEAKKEILNHWYDFQKEYTEKLGLERIMSLEKALDYAGLGADDRIYRVYGTVCCYYGKDESRRPGGIDYGRSPILCRGDRTYLSEAGEDGVE